MFILFMLAAARAVADDLDRDALAKLTAEVPTVTRTVATAGKQTASCPPVAPSAPPLPLLIRENCPGFIGQPVTKYPLSNQPTLRGTTPISAVDQKDLPRLYQTVMKLNLPWGDRTHCIQRALILSYCLDQVLGIHVGKLFVDNDGGVIMPQYPDNRKVQPWQTHQAVQIMVGDAKGNIQPYVIDPATKGYIAPIEDWKKALKGHGTISLGAPNAMSTDEAADASPPAYNSDAVHNIARLWKKF